MKTTVAAWLEAGLGILIEVGADHLTIENLCQKLGVTKGSFYHHFKNRQYYQEALLGYWEATCTQDLISKSQREGTPLERLRLLTRYSMALPMDLEIAMRAWALRDPQARATQEQVDSLRLRYMEELYGAIQPADSTGRSLALTAYACFVGSQQIVPRLPEQDLMAIFEQLWRLAHALEMTGENHGSDA